MVEEKKKTIKDVLKKADMAGAADKVKNNWILNTGVQTWAAMAMTALVLVIAPMFTPGFDMVQYLYIGFWLMYFLKLGLMFFVNHMFIRYTTIKRREDENYTKVIGNLDTSKRKIENEYLGMALEEFCESRSIIERVVALKRRVEKQVAGEQDQEKKKDFQLKKEKLNTLLASLKTKVPHEDYLEEFSHELSDYSHLDIDDMMLFGSVNAKFDEASNKFIMDEDKFNKAYYKKMLRNNAVFTFVLGSLTFTAAALSGPVMSIITFLVLMFVNIWSGTNGGNAKHDMAMDKLIAREMLIASFFGTNPKSVSLIEQERKAKEAAILAQKVIDDKAAADKVELDKAKKLAEDKANEKLAADRAHELAMANVGTGKATTSNTKSTILGQLEIGGKIYEELDPEQKYSPTDFKDLTTIDGKTWGTR